MNTPEDIKRIQDNLDPMGIDTQLIGESFIFRPRVDFMFTLMDEPSEGGEIKITHLKNRKTGPGQLKLTYDKNRKVIE